MSCWNKDELENMLFDVNEEFEIHPGEYVKIKPGESVSICSLERIDFSNDAIRQLYPDKQLMGWITPTTTMMREGISQVTTKIDSGYKGYLNWSLRNSSFRDLLISHGEPIYKLTIFLLDSDTEIPQELYGEREDDKYQNTAGIHKSSRKIAADYGKAIETHINGDPGIRLEDAGFPYDLIARKFTGINDEFNNMKSQFKRFFINTGTSAVGALIVAYSGLTFLGELGFSNNGVAFIALVIAISIFLGLYFYNRIKD